MNQNFTIFFANPLETKELGSKKKEINKPINLSDCHC